MWVYVCVYAYTHTNCTDGVLGCEPRGRKGHLEGLKNPDGLNLGIYVFRICVQGRYGKWKGVVRCGTPGRERSSTHVYIYAERREEILDKLLFSFIYFFFRIRKAKDVNAKNRFLKSRKD